MPRSNQIIKTLTGLVLGTPIAIGAVLITKSLRDFDHGSSPLIADIITGIGLTSLLVLIVISIGFFAHLLGKKFCDILQ